MRRYARPVILFVIAAAISLISPGTMDAPDVHQQSPTVQAGNPCSSLPAVCRYKYDPRENCCVADPRFDCYDVCF